MRQHSLPNTNCSHFQASSFQMDHRSLKVWKSDNVKPRNPGTQDPRSPGPQEPRPRGNQEPKNPRIGFARKLGSQEPRNPGTQELNNCHCHCRCHCHCHCHWHWHRHWYCHCQRHCPNFQTLKLNTIRYLQTFRHSNVGSVPTFKLPMFYHTFTLSNVEGNIRCQVPPFINLWSLNAFCKFEGL